MRALTAIVLGILAALCGVAIHPATAAPAAGCSTTRAFAAAARQVGADPNTIGFGHTPRDAWGITVPVGEFHSRAIVSTAAPCWVVPAVVRHEWMHVQQISYFGRSGLSTRTEIIADCGSWMLGSTYTPYIDLARRTGTAGCTADDALVARFLIQRAGVRPVRYL